jgi:SAM-dependent methyltransferase
MTGPNDPTYLLTRQYSNAEKLNVRIDLHRRFSTNPYGWHCFVFDHLLAALPRHAVILEIGCGPADLWRTTLDRLPPDWHVTLADFSPGMLDAARQALAPSLQFIFAVADAQSLPFPDAAFDAAVANHMLYHVPDRAKALSELRRVLKPTGVLFAATNGERHMAELTDFATQASTLEAWRGTAELIAAFSLENARDQLASYFPKVALAPYDDALDVTEAAPLIAYIQSLYGGTQLSPDQLTRLHHSVDDQIAAHGAVHITKSAGLFIASKNGAFLPLPAGRGRKAPSPAGDTHHITR